MSLEIEVRSSGPDGKWAAYWGQRRPSLVSELVTETCALVAQRAPASGVAIVIRKTEGRQG